MDASISRRGLLKSATAIGVGSAFTLQPKIANANPMNLPIGLQLYTVGKEMDADPSGTTNEFYLVEKR